MYLTETYCSLSERVKIELVERKKGQCIVCSDILACVLFKTVAEKRMSYFKKPKKMKGKLYADVI